MKPKDEHLILDRSGDPLCKIVIESVEDSEVCIVVYEVDEFEYDSKLVTKESRYFSAAIKFSGCSHLWIGWCNETQKSDGYVHLCGQYGWRRHIEIIDLVWDKMCNLWPRILT